MCFVRIPHLPARAAALQDHDGARVVCKQTKHERMSYLVVWMAADLGPIGHASIVNNGGRCWQQQQPDGHASAWTEWSPETVQRKV
jgi:hypothetical protein